MRLAALLLFAACSAREPARPTAPAPITAPGLRLPEGVTPLAYDLRLDVDPDREDFHGHADIRIRLSAPADHFWIHEDELDISRATFLGGTLAQIPVAGDQMRAYSFGRTLPAGETTISFDYTGHTKHDQEGVFRQLADGREYLYTQGQSVLARRILPCFDEPRWKVPWKLALVVPEREVAVANTPQLSERALPDGRREIAFAATPPMPSYLLAFAVGPFELVDAGAVGRAHVPVRVVALAGQRDRVAVVRAELPAVVAAAEKLFDDALPLAKLDLVVVPHFFGAMENPGLITFEESILVGNPEHTAFRHHFIRTVAHEIVHQWYGDLITPAWWDDLWLAESFASWLGDVIAGDLGVFADLGLEHARERRAALDADSEPDTHPLRRRIEHNEDPDEDFDEIAYGKGEVVLQMFDTFAPLEGAVRELVRRHRGSTVTTQDLAALIGNAALTDMIDRAGPPIVELALHCDGKPAVDVHVRDGRSVPICLGSSCAVVRGSGSIDVGATCPRAIAARSPRYYEIVWKTQAPLGPLPPLASLDHAELLAIGDDLAAAFERGDVTPGDAQAALGQLARAGDPYAHLAALAVANAIDPLVDDAARPRWSQFLSAHFTIPPPRSAAEVELRDELALVLPAAPGIRGLDPAHPDPTLVAFAAPGRAIFDRIAGVARAGRDADLREAAIESLGRFPADDIDRAIDFYLHTADLPAVEAWAAVAGYFDRGATRTAAWRATSARLGPIISRMTAEEAPAVITSISTLCDTALRAEAVAAFEPRLHDIADGRRHFDRALEKIDRCIARRARAGDVLPRTP